MTADPTSKIATDAHSGPTRWRKKPVVIDALRYDGDNAQQVIDWITTSSAAEGAAVLSDGELMIVTLEDGSLEGSQAKHIASVGDWVIRGLVGEFYACKPDVFAKSYEPDDVAPEVESL